MSRQLQRRLAAAHPGSTVLDFVNERTEYRDRGGKLLAVETHRGWLVPKASAPATTAPRAREHRAAPSAKRRTTASSSDDPGEPEPDGLGLWDHPLGLFAEVIDGYADQLAQGLADFGDDLRRHAAIEEDSRRSLLAQVAELRTACRDAQERLRGELA